jgi:hypothetical protein
MVRRSSPVASSSWPAVETDESFTELTISHDERTSAFVALVGADRSRALPDRPLDSRYGKSGRKTGAGHRRHHWSGSGCRRALHG